ncbi:MAG: hypothetical protein DWH82_13035 [Planctomycetota bacterium]|nr:MAG: hypothetical protein DWH82_13035 [Planctomycetota bacterium]
MRLGAKPFGNIFSHCRLFEPEYRQVPGAIEIHAHGDLFDIVRAKSPGALNASGVQGAGGL